MPYMVGRQFVYLESSLI